MTIILGRSFLPERQLKPPVVSSGIADRLQAVEEIQLEDATGGAVREEV